MCFRHCCLFAVLAFLHLTPAYPGTLDSAAEFYLDPDSSPAVWVRNHPDDPRAASIARSIAGVPMARWFGNWSGDVQGAVQQYVDRADAAHRVAILVAYDIPGRDCAGASAGGAVDAPAYRSWIDAFSLGIAGRNAVVIVEPDATAQLGCTHNPDERLDLLRYAISRLRLNAPAAKIYLDGGNAHWIAAEVMATRLNAAGLQEAKGFALNVSNFYTTSQSTAYAAAVNAALLSQFGYTKPFAVDTSRNGNGSDGQWCNPYGRKIGAPAGVISDSMLSLWIKVPGNSDGPCGSAASSPAGVFSPELALHLIDGT